MCVTATAKRRRKQMKLDKRFKNRDAETAARRQEKARQAESRMKTRK